MRSLPEIIALRDPANYEKKKTQDVVTRSYRSV